MRLLNGLLIVLIVALAAAGPMVTPDRTDEAIGDVCSEVVAALPEDVHMRILAVGEFQGPRGSEMRQRLTNLVEEGTDFVLTERAKVDQVLQEQALQAGALVDPEARVQFGRLLGAEGLLFGSVETIDKRWPGRVHVVVQVTLDDVQRGTVVFSRRFEQSLTSPWGTAILAFAGTCLVLLLAAVWLRTAGLARRHGRLDRARERREDAAAEAKQADALLAELQTRAHREDETLARKIREVRDALDGLRQKVEAAAGGDPDLQPAHRDRSLRRTDEEVERAVRSFRQRCQALSKLDRLPQASAVATLLEELRAADAAFQARKVQ